MSTINGNFTTVLPNRVKKACHTLSGKIFDNGELSVRITSQEFLVHIQIAFCCIYVRFCQTLFLREKIGVEYQFRYAARLLLCTFRLPDGNPRIRFFLPTLYMFYYQLIFLFTRIPLCNRFIFSRCNNSHRKSCQ